MLRFLLIGMGQKNNPRIRSGFTVLRFPPRRKSVYLAAIFERPQGWQPVEKVYAPSNFVKRQLKTVIDCV